MNWYYVKVAHKFTQQFTLLSQLMLIFLSKKKRGATQVQTFKKNNKKKNPDKNNFNENFRVFFGILVYFLPSFGKWL